ncbi:Efflux transporter, RND family, MFP subunit [Nostocoides japonicum T1-X7]|uniref:Efflux transporter, RND family, MFP subunit n=1 Tax=Nostocoides japonicum T1-X7 TaxID=1194083 RepID=A0A077LZU1_9MICO|nr:Efflux transporter, RND family, MFP subunit [Tetrasphaera japonica T1-X7]
MRRGWRRGLSLSVAAAALIAVGAGGAIWWEGRADASSATTTRTQLVAASSGTVKQTVSASGTLSPKNTSTATFGSSGTVTDVDVAVGDKVTKGETLATIDDDDLQDAVDLAEASVTAAEDQVDSATAGTSAAASAQAQLTSAEQSLTQAEQALAGATLKAPLSGIVSSVGYAVGDTTGSGSSGTSGGSGGSGGTGGTGGTGSSNAGGNGSSSSDSSSGITIVDTSSWVVDATVSSSDLAQLKKGLQATITGTGSQSSVFGTVSSIGVVASSTTSGAAQFPVTIAVTGNPAGLHAGTSVTVAITTKQLSGVLTVPTLAVTTTNGRTTVTVSKDGKQTVTPITIGGVYGAQTVVTKGLSSGDEVVVTYRTFAPGAGTGGTGTRRTGEGGFGGFGGGFGGQGGTGGLQRSGTGGAGGFGGNGTGEGGFGGNG